MNLDPTIQLNLFEHSSLLNHFSKLYKINKLPNKILLSGEKGVGKCTFAYHLINLILSENEDLPYDINNNLINNENRSFKLIQNKSCPNFNLIDITENRKNINIDQIRDLIINLNKSSFNNKPRFVLIDNIELLNKNSVNALLKILEEPNKRIVFILINNNKKILPTLKSRCLNFKMSLTHKQSIKITNNILKTNINELLHEQLYDS
ncbi:AAA family ATPase, partial [Candidatus Pelagibacter sp.]|nr:AAA family ATPase [Candidatus Pelagibacter sp.]